MARQMGSEGPPDSRGWCPDNRTAWKLLPGAEDGGWRTVIDGWISGPQLARLPNHRQGEPRIGFGQPQVHSFRWSASLTGRTPWRQIALTLGDRYRSQHDANVLVRAALGDRHGSQSQLCVTVSHGWQQSALPVAKICGCGPLWTSRPGGQLLSGAGAVGFCDERLRQNLRLATGRVRARR